MRKPNRIIETFMALAFLSIIMVFACVANAKADENKDIIEVTASNGDIYYRTTAFNVNPWYAAYFDAWPTNGLNGVVLIDRGYADNEMPEEIEISTMSYTVPFILVETDYNELNGDMFTFCYYYTKYEVTADFVSEAASKGVITVSAGDEELVWELPRSTFMRWAALYRYTEKLQ